MDMEILWKTIVNKQRRQNNDSTQTDRADRTGLLEKDMADNHPDRQIVPKNI